MRLGFSLEIGTYLTPMIVPASDRSDWIMAPAASYSPSVKQRLGLGATMTLIPDLTSWLTCLGAIGALRSHLFFSSHLRASTPFPFILILMNNKVNLEL